MRLKTMICYAGSSHGYYHPNFLTLFNTLYNIGIAYIPTVLVGISVMWNVRCEVFVIWEV